MKLLYCGAEYFLSCLYNASNDHLFPVVFVYELTKYIPRNGQFKKKKKNLDKTNQIAWYKSPL